MNARTQKSPPAATLARAVQDYLAAAGFKGEVTYQPSQERVMARRADGVAQFVLLPSLARGWPEGERAQARYLDRCLLMLREGPALASDAVLAERLLPRLYPREHFALTALRRRVAEAEEGEPSPELSIPSRPFNAELSVGLVFEMTDDAAEVNDARFATWGRDFAALEKLAVDNLRRRTHKPIVKGRGGVFHSNENDGHDGARLLLPERLEGLPLQGDAVVMVPHVELLLVAGADDDAALKAMGEMGLDACQQALGLTGTAFKRNSAGAWVPWLPAAGRPCFESMRLAALPAGVGYAESQRELLASLGQDLAQAAVIEDKGKPYSACVWVRGEAPLLPKSERIVFALPGAGDDGQPLPVAVRSWDAVASLPGVTLKPQGMLPERYLAEGFPEPDALSKP